MVRTVQEPLPSLQLASYTAIHASTSTFHSGSNSTSSSRIPVPVKSTATAILKNAASSASTGKPRAVLGERNDNTTIPAPVPIPQQIKRKSRSSQLTIKPISTTASPQQPPSRTAHSPSPRSIRAPASIAAPLSRIPRPSFTRLESGLDEDVTQLLDVDIRAPGSPSGLTTDSEDDWLDGMEEVGNLTAGRTPMPPRRSIGSMSGRAVMGQGRLMTPMNSQELSISTNRPPSPGIKLNPVSCLPTPPSSQSADPASTPQRPSPPTRRRARPSPTPTRRSPTATTFNTSTPLVDPSPNPRIKKNPRLASLGSVADLKQGGIGTGTPKNRLEVVIPLRSGQRTGESKGKGKGRASSGSKRSSLSASQGSASSTLRATASQLTPIRRQNGSPAPLPSTAPAASRKSKSVSPNLTSASQTTNKAKPRRSRAQPRASAPTAVARSAGTAAGVRRKSFTPAALRRAIGRDIEIGVGVPDVESSPGEDPLLLKPDGDYDDDDDLEMDRASRSQSQSSTISSITKGKGKARASGLGLDLGSGSAAPKRVITTFPFRPYTTEPPLPRIVPEWVPRTIRKKKVEQDFNMSGVRSGPAYTAEGSLRVENDVSVDYEGGGFGSDYDSDEDEGEARGRADDTFMNILSRRDVGGDTRGSRSGPGMEMRRMGSEEISEGSTVIDSEGEDELDGLGSYVASAKTTEADTEQRSHSPSPALLEIATEDVEATAENSVQSTSSPAVQPISSIEVSSSLLSRTELDSPSPSPIRPAESLVRAATPNVEQSVDLRMEQQVRVTTSTIEHMVETAIVVPLQTYEADIAKSGANLAEMEDEVVQVEVEAADMAVIDAKEDTSLEVKGNKEKVISTDETVHNGDDLRVVEEQDMAVDPTSAATLEDADVTVELDETSWEESPSMVLVVPVDSSSDNDGMERDIRLADLNDDNEESLPQDEQESLSNKEKEGYSAQSPVMASQFTQGQQPDIEEDRGDDKSIKLNIDTLTECTSHIPQPDHTSHIASKAETEFIDDSIISSANGDTSDSRVDEHADLREPSVEVPPIDQPQSRTERSFEEIARSSLTSSRIEESEGDLTLDEIGNGWDSDDSAEEADGNDDRSVISQASEEELAENKTEQEAETEANAGSTSQDRSKTAEWQFTADPLSEKASGAERSPGDIDVSASINHHCPDEAIEASSSYLASLDAPVDGGHEAHVTRGSQAVAPTSTVSASSLTVQSARQDTAIVTAPLYDGKIVLKLIDRGIVKIESEDEEEVWEGESEYVDEETEVPDESEEDDLEEREVIHDRPVQASVPEGSIDEDSGDADEAIVDEIPSEEEMITVPGSVTQPVDAPGRSSSVPLQASPSTPPTRTAPLSTTPTYSPPQSALDRLSAGETSSPSSTPNPTHEHTSESALQASQAAEGPLVSHISPTVLPILHPKSTTAPLRPSRLSQHIENETPVFSPGTSSSPDADSSLPKTSEGIRRDEQPSLEESALIEEGISVRSAHRSLLGEILRASGKGKAKELRDVVEVSSLDPRAAARAAAILKLNHNYVEHGILPEATSDAPRTPSHRQARRKSYKSQHFASVASARKLTREELLNEAELEIVVNEAIPGRRVREGTAFSAISAISGMTDLPLPGAWVRTPKRKRSDPLESRNLESVEEATARDNSENSARWGISEWKRLEKVYRAEKEAWIKEREVKTMPGGFMGWARRSSGIGMPKVDARAWDDKRVVEKFLQSEGIEKGSGEFDETVILLRVQALERRVAAKLSEPSTSAVISESTTKKTRTVAPIPSTPRRLQFGQVATPSGLAPPSTIKRLVNWVLGTPRADRALHVSESTMMSRSKGKGRMQGESSREGVLPINFAGTSVAVAPLPMRQVPARSVAIAVPPPSRSNLPRLSGRDLLETPGTSLASQYISNNRRAGASQIEVPTSTFTPALPSFDNVSLADTSLLGLSTSSTATDATFPPQTPRLYPPLDRSISQRSAAIKALFPAIYPLGHSTSSTSSSSTAGNSSFASASRPVSLPGLSRKTSVKDIAKSFEEKGVLENVLKRVPSGASEIEALRRVRSNDRR